MSLGVLWESLGGPLGSLDVLWMFLGRPLDVLGSPLEVLGGPWLLPQIIETPLVFIVFQSIEAPLGGTWEVFGDCGAFSEVLVPFLGGPLGNPWASLGGPWDSLGVLRGVYGVQRGYLEDGGRQSRSSNFCAA